MSVRDGAHATVGEWIAWATGVGSPKTTEHQRDVPAARRPSGEDKLIGAAAGWGAGAAAFIVAVRAAGHALAVVRIAAHYHIAPVVGALCVAASGVSAALNLRERHPGDRPCLVALARCSMVGTRTVGIVLHTSHSKLIPLVL